MARTIEDLQAEILHYNELTAACAAIGEMREAFAYQLLARKCWNIMKDLRREEDMEDGRRA